jgi:hypothetical protein
MRKFVIVLLLLVIGISPVMAQRVVRTVNLKQLESVYINFQEQARPDDSIIEESSFDDVSSLPLHMRLAVTYLSENVALFQGDGEGAEFGVREPVLRAVVAEILLRLAEMGSFPDYQTVELSGMELFDVPEGVWFERAVRIAVENEIFIPQDGYVRPADSVNWAEMVTLLRRFFGLAADDDAQGFYFWVPKGEWFTGEFAALRHVGILIDFKKKPSDLPQKIDFVLLLNRAVGSFSVFSESKEEFNCHSEFSFDDLKEQECLLDYAVSTLDKEICLALSDMNSYKYTCLEAIDKKKRGYTVQGCRDGDPYMEEFCIRDIAVHHNDLSICDEIPSSNYMHEYCRIEIGKRRLDSNLCEGSHECYDFIAKATLDLSLCEKMPIEMSERVKCFAYVYGELGQLENCDFDDEYYSQICLDRVAYLRRDPSLCSGSSCQDDMALEYRDVGYCFGNEGCERIFEYFGSNSLICEYTENISNRLLCARHCVELGLCPVNSY